MTEAVEILIKADDQASQKFKDAAVNVDKSLKRVEQIMSSLEAPSEKYNKQLRELEHLQREGAISGEQFAVAQEKLRQKIEGNAASMKDVGGQTKKTTDFVKTLASLTGSSELGNLAGQLGDVADKAGQFSEVSKAGGAGAMAFKGGLVTLAAAAGWAVGSVLGEFIFKTKETEKALLDAAEASKVLDAQLKTMANTMLAGKKEDIELIRDPKQKQAAYTELMQNLARDITQVEARVRRGTAEVEEWQDSWKITGNQKAFAAMADAQLATDKEQLELLKSQAAEIEKIAGARALENEAIRAGNEAKDRSESYLDTLRQEVEYMKATREEQIKIDALRNTVAEDRGEAEQLLRDRDAIIAKADATKEADAAQRKMADEAAKAAEKAEQDAEREIQRVEDLIAKEQERLALQRMEVEHGKEAARAQALFNQGVDVMTAKQLAAEEAAIELMKQRKAEADKPVEEKKVSEVANLQASQSRLLTRGSGQSPMDQTNKILEATQKHTEQLAKFNEQQLAAQQQIAANTANTLTVRPTT